MLVVAGDSADVEDDGDRVHALGERVPGLHQLPAPRGVVSVQERVPERRLVGQRGAVEGEAKELREARFTRPVEARDPGRGKLGPTLLRQLLKNPFEQVDELFVDTGLHAAASRIALGVAAR